MRRRQREGLTFPFLYEDDRFLLFMSTLEQQAFLQYAQEACSNLSRLQQRPAVMRLLDQRCAEDGRQVRVQSAVRQFADQHHSSSNSDSNSSDTTPSDSTSSDSTSSDSTSSVDSSDDDDPDYVDEDQQRMNRQTVRRPAMPRQRASQVQQANTAARQVARVNLPPQRVNEIRQSNTEAHQVARVNLPPQRVDEIRQSNTQAHQVARSTLPSGGQVDNWVSKTLDCQALRQQFSFEWIMCQLCQSYYLSGEEGLCCHNGDLILPESAFPPWSTEYLDLIRQNQSVLKTQIGLHQQ